MSDKSPDVLINNSLVLWVTIQPRIRLWNLAGWCFVAISLAIRARLDYLDQRKYRAEPFISNSIVDGHPLLPLTTNSQ